MMSIWRGRLPRSIWERSGRRGTNNFVRLASMARLTGRASMQCLERSLGEAIGLANQTQNPGIDQPMDGRADALGRMVARHQDRVARLVYRLLGWRGDVDDVV